MGRPIAFGGISHTGFQPLHGLIAVKTIGIRLLSKSKQTECRKHAG